jgi:hypothetical protein
VKKARLLLLRLLLLLVVEPKNTEDTQGTGTYFHLERTYRSIL